MRQRLRSPKFLAAALAAALLVAVLFALLDRSFLTAAGLLVFGSGIVLALLLVVRRERALRWEAQRARRALQQQAVAGDNTPEMTSDAAPVDCVELLSHATGERPADRARVLEQSLGLDRACIGTITGDALKTRLREQAVVVDLMPGLGSRQLPAHLSCLVIDETSFADGVWEGVLDARHTMKFLDLRVLLLAARELEIPTLLIQQDHASHHSADLSLLAETVISDRGAVLAAGGQVPAAVLDAVVHAQEGGSS